MPVDPATFDPPRRRALLTTRTGAASIAPPRLGSSRQSATALAQTIPSVGEAIPVVGLGTWITFNVGSDPVDPDACAKVMRAFFAAGGRMVNASQTYGASRPVIGHGLRTFGRPAQLLLAEKVWVDAGGRGRVQMEESRTH